MPLDQTINNQINLAGEEITDASVWIKKTHDPASSPGGAVIHKSNKIICIVRNPFDTIISSLNLISGDHSGQLNEDLQKDIPAFWQAFVREKTNNFKDFHSFVLLEAMEHVPVHLMRYEDLLIRPQETLEDLFCFVMGKKSVEGLNIQKRIKAAVEMGHKSTQAYSMKVDMEEAGQKKKTVFNRNISKYTEEQQSYVSETLKDFMEIFGYCSKLADGEKEDFVTSEDWLEEQQEKFNFAKYKEINEEQFESFKKFNQEQLERMIGIQEDGKNKDHVFVMNHDPSSQIKSWQNINRDDLVMNISLKEKPQIKK